MPYRIANFDHFPHDVPDATELAAGVMSVADKIKLDSLSPGSGTNALAYALPSGSFTLDLAANFQFIYVSPTGSDILGNGTIGSPYATPGRAVEDIPLSRTKRVIIHLAAATYDVGPAGLILPNFPGDGGYVAAPHPMLSFVEYGDVTLECDLLVLATLGAVTQTPRAISGLLNVQAAGVTWTVNQFINKVLIDGSGNEGAIFGNTVDTLFVANASGFSGSGMKIIDEGVTLLVSDATSSANVISFPGTNSLVVRGAKLRGAVPNQNTNFGSFGPANFTFQVCDFAGLGLSSGAARVRLGTCSIHPEDNVAGHSVLFAGNCALTMTNCYVSGQLFMFGFDAPDLPSVEQCFIENGVNPICQVIDSAPNAGAQFSSVELSATSIVFSGNARGFLTTVGWSGVSSSGTGAGLLVANGAIVRSQQLLGTTGAGQLGVRVQKGGQLFGDITSTLAGDMGAMQVGDLDVLSWDAWNNAEPRQLARDAMGDGSSLEGSTATLSVTPSQIQRPVFMKTGPNLASASTLAPTAGQHVVTGAATINNMSLPYPGFEGPVTLVSTAGTWQMAVGGGAQGFAATLVAVPGHHYVFVYVAATQLWYPKG